LSPFNKVSEVRNSVNNENPQDDLKNTEELTPVIRNSNRTNIFRFSGIK